MAKNGKHRFYLVHLTHSSSSSNYKKAEFGTGTMSRGFGTTTLPKINSKYRMVNEVKEKQSTRKIRNNRFLQFSMVSSRSK
jgi:hypothetical protein